MVKAKLVSLMTNVICRSFGFMISNEILIRYQSYNFIVFTMIIIRFYLTFLCVSLGSPQKRSILTSL